MTLALIPKVCPGGLAITAQTVDGSLVPTNVLAYSPSVVQAVYMKAGTGSCALTFGGQTATVATGAPAAAIASALNALSSIGGVSGSVAVAGEAPSQVTFGGTLGSSAQPLITAVTSGMSATGTAPALTAGSTTQNWYPSTVGANYALVGTGWAPLAAGFGTAKQVVAAGSGLNQAEWTVTGLATGHYQISYDSPITGSVNPTISASTPFRFYDGSTPRAHVIVNQSNFADTLGFGGAHPSNGFQVLADVYITSGTLRVVVSDEVAPGDIGKFILTNEIAVVPLDPAPVQLWGGATDGTYPQNVVKVGTWTHNTNGWNNAEQYCQDVSGSSVTFNFVGLLPNSTYKFAVHWREGSGNTTVATYTVRDWDGTVLGSATYDQTQTTSTYTHIAEIDQQGMPLTWQFAVIGTFTVSSTSASIKLPVTIVGVSANAVFMDAALAVLVTAGGYTEPVSATVTAISTGPYAITTPRLNSGNPIALTDVNWVSNWTVDNNPPPRPYLNFFIPTAYAPLLATDVVLLTGSNNCVTTAAGVIPTIMNQAVVNRVGQTMGTVPASKTLQVGYNTMMVGANLPFYANLVRNGYIIYLGSTGQSLTANQYPQFTHVDSYRMAFGQSYVNPVDSRGYPLYPVGGTTTIVWDGPNAGYFTFLLQTGTTMSFVSMDTGHATGNTLKLNYVTDGTTFGPQFDMVMTGLSDLIWSGDTNRVTTSGTWTTQTGSGWNGSYLRNNKVGTDKATYHFGSLPAGTYDVLAFWTANAGNTQHAVYTLKEGGAVVATSADIDQTMTASSPTTDYNTTTQHGQGVVSGALTGGVVTVEVTGGTDGYLRADAVQMALSGNLAPVTPDLTDTFVGVSGTSLFSSIPDVGTTAWSLASNATYVYQGAPVSDIQFDGSGYTWNAAVGSSIVLWPGSYVGSTHTVRASIKFKTLISGASTAGITLFTPASAAVDTRFFYDSAAAAWTLTLNGTPYTSAFAFPAANTVIEARLTIVDATTRSVTCEVSSDGGTTWTTLFGGAKTYSADAYPFAPGLIFSRGSATQTATTGVLVGNLRVSHVTPFVPWANLALYAPDPGINPASPPKFHPVYLRALKGARTLRSLQAIGGINGAMINYADYPTPAMMTVTGATGYYQITKIETWANPNGFWETNKNNVMFTVTALNGARLPLISGTPVILPNGMVDIAYVSGGGTFNLSNLLGIVEHDAGRMASNQFAVAGGGIPSGGSPTGALVTQTGSFGTMTVDYTACPPVDYFALVASLPGCAAWLNPTPIATQACITQLANDYMAAMPVGSICYVECADEPWNNAGGFPYYQYFFGYGALNGLNTMKGYAKLSAQIHDWFATAMGSRSGELRRVFNCQFTVPTAGSDVLAYCDAHSKTVDALAVATYIINGPGNVASLGTVYPNLTAAQLVDNMAGKLESSNEYQSQLAAYKTAVTGHPPTVLVNYEGGLSSMQLGGDQVNQEKQSIGARYHPGVYTLILDYLSMLDSYGVKLLNYYSLDQLPVSDITSYVTSTYGVFDGWLSVAGRGDGSDGLTDNRIMIGSTAPLGLIDFRTVTAVIPGAINTWNSGSVGTVLATVRAGDLNPKPPNGLVGPASGSLTAGYPFPSGLGAPHPPLATSAYWEGWVPSGVTLASGLTVSLVLADDPAKPGPGQTATFDVSFAAVVSGATTSTDSVFTGTAVAEVVTMPASAGAITILTFVVPSANFAGSVTANSWVYLRIRRNPSLTDTHRGRIILENAIVYDT